MSKVYEDRSHSFASQTGKGEHEEGVTPVRKDECGQHREVAGNGALVTLGAPQSPVRSVAAPPSGLPGTRQHGHWGEAAVRTPHPLPVRRGNRREPGRHRLQRSAEVWGRLPGLLRPALQVMAPVSSDLQQLCPTWRLPWATKEELF